MRSIILYYLQLKYICKMFRPSSVNHQRVHISYMYKTDFV
jgi:hypothetical protein